MNFTPRQSQFPVIVTRDRPEKLLDALWSLRHRHCKDDRDRIYAAPSFILQDLPTEVDVDYDRAEVEVYTAFKQTLPKARIMKILLFAGIWDRKELLQRDGPRPSSLIAEVPP